LLNTRTIATTKSFDTFDGLTITHGQVVINKIHRDNLCQHVQCGGDLLDGAMAKLFGDIPPLLEKCAVLHNRLANGFEQFDSHYETPRKIFFWKNGIIHKVSPYQLIVSFNPLLPQLLPTKATMLRPLVVREVLLVCSWP
jgi:hypothetical protein